MKMFNIKLIVTLVSLIFGLTNNIIAQVDSHEKCIFKIEQNRHEMHNIIVEFNGYSAYIYHRNGNFNGLGYDPRGFHDDELKYGFKKSDSFLDKLSNKSQLTVDSDLSTSVRTVYYYKQKDYTCYIAVDKEITTIKCWSKSRSGSIFAGLTGANSYSGVAAECVRVDPEIFKPKAVNYDFLND